MDKTHRFFSILAILVISSIISANIAFSACSEGRVDFWTQTDWSQGSGQDTWINIGRYDYDNGFVKTTGDTQGTITFIEEPIVVYDSGWKPLARGTHDNSIINCNEGGISRTRVNAGSPNFHTYANCEDSAWSTNPPYKVAFNLSEDSNPLSLPHDTLKNILGRGGSVTIRINADDSYGRPTGEGEYYISINGKYSGEGQTAEFLRTEVNGQSQKSYDPKKDDEKFYWSCSYKERFHLNSGNNFINFTVPADSIHLVAYRISSFPPPEINTCYNTPAQPYVPPTPKGLLQSSVFDLSTTASENWGTVEWDATGNEIDVFLETSSNSDMTSSNTIQLSQNQDLSSITNNYGRYIINLTGTFNASPVFNEISFCKDEPIDGECGSAHERSFIRTPRENLCRGEDPTIPILNPGETQWNWQCPGTNGGDPAYCHAIALPSDPECGLADGGLYPIATHPRGPQEDLCLSGDVYPNPLRTDEDQWNWKCLGIQNDKEDICVAFKEEQTQCGQAHTKEFSTTPDSQLCSKGILENFIFHLEGKWTWNCNAGNANSECYATLVKQDPECGTAIDNTHKTKPTENLCDPGHATEPFLDASDNKWRWSCIGPQGYEPVTCAADYTADQGKCGSANEQYFITVPRENLCKEGNETPPIYDDELYQWDWECIGISTTANCKAYPDPRINGECGKDLEDSYDVTPPDDLLCEKGKKTQPTLVGNQWKWSCLAIGNGIDAHCSTDAIQTPGECGDADQQSFDSTPTEKLCKTGEKTQPTLVGNQWTWQCLGINSDVDDSCSATAITTDGECGGDDDKRLKTDPTDLCKKGDIFPVPINFDTRQWTWQCLAIGNGIDASCNAWVDGGGPRSRPCSTPCKQSSCDNNFICNKNKKCKRYNDQDRDSFYTSGLGFSFISRDHLKQCGLFDCKETVYQDDKPPCPTKTLIFLSYDVKTQFCTNSLLLQNSLCSPCINPGAPESCHDDEDNNCNDKIDEDCKYQETTDYEKDIYRTERIVYYNGKPIRLIIDVFEK